MKNLMNVIVVIVCINCFCIQKSFSKYIFPLNTIENQNMQADTLNHDLFLMKPIINFNDSNGGFYSEYYWSSFQKLYCGAIVQNTGHLGSSNVCLELSFLDYNNSVVSTYYSDTILTLNPSSIDTLKIQQSIFLNDWYYRVSYKIKSDSIDENEVNNIDTLPYITLCDDMWSQISRANISTSTLNVNQIPNFHSGDFIGTTLKTTGSMGHWLVAMSVYINGLWPDSFYMVGKIYQNNLLIDSIPINNQGELHDWVYASFPDYSFNRFILPDRTYYFGVELFYSNNTNIPIGIDTSSFHNFQTETIGRIGGVWSSLNFVPLIRLLCDPEQVSEINNENQIQVFPNPTHGTINIINVENSLIELYNLTGNLLFSDYSNESSKNFDLSMFTEGYYLIKIKNKHGTTNKKITIIK